MFMSRLSFMLQQMAAQNKVSLVTSVGIRQIIGMARFFLREPSHSHGNTRLRVLLIIPETQYTARLALNYHPSKCAKWSTKIGDL